MRQAPDVSVVVPAFNAARFIAEAIESVASQETSLRYEMVVVDDGLTDGTAAVVRSASRATPCDIRLITQDNGGPGAARNAGVDASQASVIVFLDADDRMLPMRLDTQGRFLLDNPHASVCFGDIVIQNNEEDGYLACWGFDDTGDAYLPIHDPLARLLAVGSFVPNTASAVRRSDFLQVGGQRTDVRCAEDYDLWCRLASGGKSFFYTRQPLSWVRREKHGHLMSTDHRYVGEVVVLLEQLAEHAASMADGDRYAAKNRLRKRANMLLRSRWMRGDRSDLEHWKRRLSPCLSITERATWACASHLPGSFGMFLKRAKLGLRRRVGPWDWFSADK